MGKKDERKYSIDFYLEKAKLSEPIKEMMKQLFKGQAKTLEEWAIVDEGINQRRVD